MSGTQRKGPALGFTLIELIVTVTVVGILSMIAMPAYQSYVLRSNRAAGKAALVDMVSREEAWFVDRKAYTSDLSSLHLQTYLSRDGSTSATQVGDSIYKLSVAGITTGNCPSTANLSTVGYTVIAEPVKVQVKDTSCATLCLTSTGIRLASAGTATKCWSH